MREIDEARLIQLLERQNKLLESIGKTLERLASPQFQVHTTDHTAPYPAHHRSEPGPPRVCHCVGGQDGQCCMRPVAPKTWD